MACAIFATLSGLISLGFISFAVYLQAVPCPLDTCFLIEGEDTFTFTHYGGELGRGGIVWYAPAGMTPSDFAEQLSFQNLTDELQMGESCGFVHEPGRQRFGLARVGFFACACDDGTWRTCDSARLHGSGNYIPPHRFVSGVQVWIWDEEKEYITHHVDGLLSFLTGALVVGGVIFFLLGACCLCAACWSCAAERRKSEIPEPVAVGSSDAAS
ncbi:unnamed protein product [Symbiodinium sp. CCMP2456]|nr:unnamed protein product [Symbiodinium sp. CCMP2456]